jgi:hypothetical protein
MTNHHHKHATNTPTDGPLPPIPPVGPPTSKISSFWMGIKVLFATAAVLALKTAYQVCSHYMTWDTFTNLSGWTKLAKLTINGFVYGLIPGLAFGLLTIAVALAGPQFWSVIGPIVIAAAAKTMNIIRGMSLAFRGLPAQPDQPEDGKETKD